MPKALDVQWDEIRKVVERGTSLVDVAKLFNISYHAVRMRSARGKWNTPNRIRTKLEQAAKEQGCRASVVADNERLAESIEAAARPGNSLLTSTGALDFDRATKDYRSKGVLKMARLLDQTILAPPRNWKDYDIADKMMRRLLGIDETEGKSNTIVQLQVVNERLKTSMQDEIIEGEFVSGYPISDKGDEQLVKVISGEKGAESVTEASPLDEPQCETTGSKPAPELSDIG